MKIYWLRNGTQFANVLSNKLQYFPTINTYPWTNGILLKSNSRFYIVQLWAITLLPATIGSPLNKVRGWLGGRICSTISFPFVFSNWSACTPYYWPCMIREYIVVCLIHTITKYHKFKVSQLDNLHCKLFTCLNRPNKHAMLSFYYTNSCYLTYLHYIWGYNHIFKFPI